MARENQGLQIALIVFVMLTIVLGGATFYFYSQFNQAKLTTDGLKADNKKKDDLAAETLNENKDLRRMMGVNETDKLADLNTQFSHDMDTWAIGFPATSKFYRPALQYMATAVKKKTEELDQKTADFEDWKKKYQAREADRDAQIKKLDAALAQSQDDYNTEREKIKADLTRLSQQEKEVTDKLAGSQKEADTKVEEAEKVKQDSMAAVTKVRGEQRSLKNKLNEVLAEVPKAFAGEIRYVSQATRMTMINLGSADNLKTRVTFKVYSGDAIDQQKAVPKGTIEISEVSSDHRAWARILDDKTTDPILPGDKIWSPLVSVGEQQHFALAGEMDLYGEGADNTNVLKNIITARGGVIDAFLDAGGEKVTGDMNVRTRYLIVGSAPKGKGKGANGFASMQNQAKTLGVEVISLKRFLELLGEDFQRVRTATYGLGGNAGKISNNPNPGPPPRSSGSPVSGVYDQGEARDHLPPSSTAPVSDLYKSRNPPARSSSAY